MADMNNDQTHKAEHAENAPNAEETRALSIPKDPNEDGHPPSAQEAQRVPGVDNLEPCDGEADNSEDDVDPADEIGDFDWDDLHERYHKTISTASEQEKELLQEFAELMHVLFACILKCKQRTKECCSTSRSGPMLAPIKSPIAPSTGMHALWYCSTSSTYPGLDFVPAWHTPRTPSRNWKTRGSTVRLSFG